MRACQSSKFYRHTQALIRLPSDARFRSLHVDLAGPVSKRMAFLLIVSRFSRWPEAIPIPDPQA